MCIKASYGAMYPFILRYEPDHHGMQRSVWRPAIRWFRVEELLDAFCKTHSH